MNLIAEGSTRKNWRSSSYGMSQNCILHVAASTPLELPCSDVGQIPTRPTRDVHAPHHHPGEHSVTE